MYKENLREIVLMQGSIHPDLFVRTHLSDFCIRKVLVRNPRLSVRNPHQVHEVSTLVTTRNRQRQTHSKCRGSLIQSSNRGIEQNTMATSIEGGTEQSNKDEEMNELALACLYHAPLSCNSFSFSEKIFPPTREGSREFHFSSSILVLDDVAILDGSSPTFL